MPENILQELQRSTDLALKSETVQEGLVHVSRAFALLTEESIRLKSAYARLQERFDAVNEEKTSEAERLAHFTQHILRQIADGVFFLNLDGTLLLLNDAAAKILQIKAVDALQKPFWDLFPDEAFGFSAREALRFGISHKILYTTFASRELEISTSFIFEGLKTHHGLVVVLRDITEKKRMQQLTSQQSKMRELGEMAAILAHEIRNPLGGIRGYASLLARDLAEAPYLQEMARAIIEGAQSLESLVTSVLQYAKPIQIQPSTVDVGRFLKTVVKFIKADPAYPPHVTWISHIPDAPLLAPLDSEAMKAALLNLIFNAFQAMPEEGRLTLSLLKMDSCYQIALSDTGIGMSEEQLSHLFSPYFTTKEKGNGIGLVEAKKIIEAHLGNIAVRSAEGKGTTFTLTLPLKR